MKKRVYAYLRGGLGNQMFIYAAARAAQLRYFGGEGEVLLSCRNLYRYIESDMARELSGALKNYRLCDSVKVVDDFRLPIVKRTIKKLCGYRLCKNPQEVYEHAVHTARFAQKFGVISCESGYIELAEKMPKTIYMDSFFQSEKYFKEIRSVLQQEFSLTCKPSKTVQMMAEQMRTTESVCIGVRLGDYINHPMHCVCTPDYYRRAVKKIKQIRPYSRFYLFSDDIQLAEQLLGLPDDHMTEPICSSSNETLWLMSNCKHFVISNSSFHWWAQYLANGADKIVIAPNKWYPQDIPCALYQDNWETIPV